MRSYARALSVMVCCLFYGQERCIAADEVPSWGTLTGQFVTERSENDVVDVELLRRIRHLAKPLQFRTVQIDETSRGIADILITLQVRQGEDYPAPHPDYNQSATDALTVQMGNAIRPHVTLIRTNQPLKLINVSPNPIHVKVDTIKNQRQAFDLGVNAVAKLNFAQEERLPVSITQLSPRPHIGWLAIRNTPYMAVTDREGRFTIKNLPSGHWDFQVWHEQAGYVTTVRRKGEDETWTRGMVELRIPTGQLDLGKLEVPLDHFEEARR